MKKRVLMLVHSNFVHDNRVRRQARTLTKNGYNVSVIAASHHPKNIKPFELDSVHVIPVPLKRSSGKLKFLEMMFKVRRELKRADADIIHAHDLDAFAACVSIATGKSWPVIYDSHELYTETHSVHRRPAVKSIWRYLENRHIRKAIKVITVSESIADELKKRYSLTERPVVIRNFTDKPGQQLSNPPYPAFQTKFTGLYQGVLQDGRGLEQLMQAVSQNADWSIILCGDGVIRNKLERLTESLEIRERVIFTGMISREEIYTIAAQCDAGFLLTETKGLNHYFSLPNKLTEYIHAGLPVIANDLPEIKRILENYKAGLIVDKKNPLNKVLSEFPGKSGFSRALARASSELSWNQEQEKLLMVYDDICAQE